MASCMIQNVGGILQVGFNPQASDSEIACDASARLQDMESGGELVGGSLIKVRINGENRMPDAGQFAIAHALSYWYGIIAVFDKERKRYVIAAVSAATSPWKIGDLID